MTVQIAVLDGVSKSYGSVEALHPTDLGFIRIADGLEPVLRTILGLSFP